MRLRSVGGAGLARFLLLFLTLAVVLSCGRASDRPLVPDSAIKSGRLRNGFEYLLRGADYPPGRIHLALVVRVGSFAEREGERGYAHFVEHMAFRGTKAFPGDEIETFIRSIGMEPGPDLDARTDYDSTVYELSLPSGDEAALETAFGILRDWADGLSFDPVVVARERGVILAERRYRDSPHWRAWEGWGNALFGDSPVVNREPIGAPSDLAAADAAGLRHFYREWYRPDLMGVVAAGDVSADELIRLVKAHFGDMNDRGGAQPPLPRTPAPHGLSVAVELAPGIDPSRLEIFARVPVLAPRTESQYIAARQRDIALALIETRLANAGGRKASAGSSAMSLERGDLRDGWDLLGISADFFGSDWERAGRALLDETARLGKYGYSADEFGAAAGALFPEFATERGSEFSSPRWLETLERSMIDRTPALPFWVQVSLAQRAMESFGPATLRRYTDLLTRGPDRFVGLALAPGQGTLPAEYLLAKMAANSPDDLGSRKSGASIQEVLAHPPAAVRPISVSHNVAVDTEERDYPNGIRAILKSVDLGYDGLALRFSTRSGLESLAPADAANAIAAADVASNSGFDDIPPDALENLFSGHGASLELQVGDATTSFAGYAPEGGAETLLSVLHRTIVETHVDPALFEAERTRLASRSIEGFRNPDDAFSSFVTRKVLPNDPRKALFASAEDARALDLSKATSLLASLVSPTVGSNFTLVGQLPLDKLEDYCDRFVGSLPTKASPFPPAEKPIPSDDPMDALMMSSATAKAAVELDFITLRSGTDERTISGLDVLADGLQREVENELRDTLGLSYSARAEALTSPETKVTRLRLTFDTDPARRSEAIRAAEAVAARIRSEGLEPAVLADALLARRRLLESDSQDYGWWADELNYRLLQRYSLDAVGVTSIALDGVDENWIREAARRYLDPAHLAVFSLMPTGTP